MSENRKLMGITTEIEQFTSDIRGLRISFGEGSDSIHCEELFFIGTEDNKSTALKLRRIADFIEKHAND